MHAKTEQPLLKLQHKPELDKSMAERCRMARLKGIKSRVQFSDNPTSRYGFFQADFCEKIKNGISTGLKVVSEIPYILQFFIFSLYERSECFISKRSGDASYCAVKRNNASSSGFYEAWLRRMKHTFGV